MRWGSIRQGLQNEDDLPDRAKVVGRARAWPSRACCCTAQPMVKVLVPRGEDGRCAVDLYLCCHHYRSARDRLDAVGADAYDATGVIVTSPGQVAVLPSRD